MDVISLISFALIFISGMVLGVIILRYGIGLGSRQAYWQKEDLEPFKPEDETELTQTHTGDWNFEKEE